MKCEGCPVQAAYARYAIEQDIQPGDVAYKEIFSGLTLMDQRKLSAMIGGQGEDPRSLDVKDCPGEPRKTCFGLGKKACQATLAFFDDERGRPIVL